MGRFKISILLAVILSIINFAIVYLSSAGIIPHWEIWNNYALGINIAAYIWIVIAKMIECHYVDIYCTIIANIVLTISYASHIIS
jgi:hypothetical protein